MNNTMILENPTEQEKTLLDKVGVGYLRTAPNFEDLSELDWYGYYPVVNDNGVLVGILPSEGLNEIEFEIDQTHDCVWESDIKDNRPNVFASNPYWDSYKE